MNKKPIEPDEMRISTETFDEMMRHALGAPPPVEPPKAAPKPKTDRRKKAPAN